MTMPLYALGSFDYAVAMALGTVLGFFFGLVLEGAGFGRASNLVAQFYGDDMRVFKVMFSAIVTAAIGLGILAGVGVVDLAALSVPGTWIWPQLIGGGLLGVGFVVAGYCPGTAVVATGSGYIDGIIALVGIMVGSVAFGFVYPMMEPLYLSGDLGGLQLHSLMGLPWPVLAMGVTVMAIGAFLGAEKVEQWVARRNGTAPPPAQVPLRNASFAAMGGAAALGLATLALPQVEATLDTPDVDTIAPSDLARALVAAPTDWYVVDLRSPEACGKARIPGALCLAEDDPDAAFLADLPPTRTVVLVGQATAEVPASAHAYAGQVRVLDGGFDAFKANVMTPPEPPEVPTPEAVAQYRLDVELAGHFSGTATRAAPIQARPKAVKRAVRKGGGC